MLIGKGNNGIVLFGLSETKISLFGSDGLKYIRRRIGEDMRPDYIIPTVKHPVSTTIWSCMASRQNLCDKLKYKCPKTYLRNI